MALTIEEPLALPRGAELEPELVPELVLDGERADAYIDRLVGAIRGARLNALFPPEHALRAHLSFLPPAGCDGLHPRLHLSAASGLPGHRDVLRVKIDRDLAPEFLADAAGRRAAPDSRMARRVAYYQRLLAAEIMPLGRMRVELRQQLPAENLARFRVVFDRFDLARATFARYTILLEQRDGFWRRTQVIVNDADLAAPTAAFRRAVGRLVADEAEIAFVLLSGIEGIRVEDVRRCRVGPLLMPGVALGGDVGEDLADLLNISIGSNTDSGFADSAADDPRWVLCFPEDRAGVDVADHASGDPLAPLFREALSPDARALIDAKADELGYRVAKSRKLVCPRKLQGPLRALCTQRDAPSIVYGV